MKIDEKSTRLKKGDKICVHLKDGTISMGRGRKKLRFSDGDDKRIIKSTSSTEPISRKVALKIVQVIAEIANLTSADILEDTDTRLLVELF